MTDMQDQDVELDLDLTGDDLTLNEQVEVERVCGGVFHRLHAERSSEFLRAVAWVIGRRTDSRFLLEDAGLLKVTFGG